MWMLSGRELCAGVQVVGDVHGCVGAVVVWIFVWGLLVDQYRQGREPGERQDTLSCVAAGCLSVIGSLYLSLISPVLRCACNSDMCGGAECGGGAE